MIGVEPTSDSGEKSMYYLGIDIGKRFHEACLVDQSGKVIYFLLSNSVILVLDLIL